MDLSIQDDHFEKWDTKQKVLENFEILFLCSKSKNSYFYYYEMYLMC